MDRLHVVELDAWIEPPVAMAALGTPGFWLDSGRRAYGTGRFSYLGDASGPGSEVLTYRVGEGVEVCAGGTVTHEPGSILDALSRRLADRREAPDLPFDFRGGYVGYLGYEVGTDCGLDLRGHRSPHPDAVWLRADRYVVHDHDERRVYLVSEGRQGEWAAAMRSRLTTARAPATPEATTLGIDLAAHLRRGPEQYRRDVEACLETLRRGESYEICLTDRLDVRLDADPLAAYLAVRQANPAPYAAFLNLGDLAVLCSSPEQFLRVSADGHVTSKPIKGTCARHGDPALDAAAAAALAADEKTRAENLMIVDLVRNDLSRTCTGVHVDPFLAVESYETVHQVVSTVHGTLRPGTDVVDVIRTCFPSGSMTGAPKHRTMQVIGDLEGAARGIYSGTIGWLGLDGAADLNVVIRTAVLADGVASVGAGGAVVLDSDPQAELDEALLKAAAPLRGLAPLLPGNRA